MSESVQYLGFEVNGEECEVALGDAFVSHVPSRDQIIALGSQGEYVINVGDEIAAEETV